MAEAFPEVIHLAGEAITMSAVHVRQRCSWCGYVLIDQDLSRAAYAVCPDPDCALDLDHSGDHSLEKPEFPTHAPGTFVGVVSDGGFTGFRLIEPDEPGKAPDGSCLLLPPELTLEVRGGPHE